MLATLKPTTDEFMTDLNAMLEKTKTTDLTTWLVCQDENEISFSKDDEVIHVVIEDDGFNTSYSRFNENNELARINDQTLDFKKVSGYFSMTFTVAWFLNLADNYPQG
jgi:hypothetical protein